MKRIDRCPLKKLDFPIGKSAPPGGLEPPTFRLTAERASQLRHGGHESFFGIRFHTIYSFGRAVFAQKTGKKRSRAACIKSNVKSIICSIEAGISTVNMIKKN